MTLRAAVVGCGMIGSGFADDPLLSRDIFTHAEAYVRSRATELVAVCDSDPAKAQRCAQRWDVHSAFSDVRQMLDETRPELVSICTPDETHYQLSRVAVEADPVRAVLCEKPLASNFEQGAELVRVAKDLGKLLAVAHVRRHATNMQSVRSLLAQGMLGPLRAISGWYGKGVLHNGSHWFDLLRMFGGEAAWVEAADRLGEVSEDPTLDVTVGLESGAVATLRASDSSAYTLFEMELLAQRGRISIRAGGHDVRLEIAKPSARYSGYTELRPDERDFGPMTHLMLRAVDDLAEAVMQGRPPLCSGDDGLAALRIAIAARKAAQMRCRIGNSPDFPLLD